MLAGKLHIVKNATRFDKNLIVYLYTLFLDDFKKELRHCTYTLKPAQGL